MRNLKKVLTLVLTLSMLLSIMVVGTGAAFSDQSSIKNTEAVDVCVALNIINGKPGNVFDPAGNVSRAEMCKMICVALNGGKEPTLGTNNVPTFSDIRTDASSAWAEAYIESCYTQGIVAGVGEGRFNPTGSITGTQAARMLLVALGYRADIEGYTGASWNVNVNVAASAKGLYADTNGMDPNATLSRDNAAQMIWNALNAYEVEYVSTLISENGTLTTKVTAQDKVVNASDNKKITLLADKYEAITRTGILTSVEYDSTDKTYTTKVTALSGDNAIPTFDASQNFSALMGQEVKAMYTLDSRTNDTILLGIYATNTNKTVTTVYGDATVKGDTAKIDGTEYNITGIQTIATNGKLISYSDYARWSDYPYVEVTLVDNDKDKVYEYAVVNPFKVAKVSSLTAKKVYFENTVKAVTIPSVDVDKLASYSGMAEKDFVYLTEGTYTVSGDWEAVKADSVSGKVAGLKGANGEESIRIDNNWYKQIAASVDVPNNGDDLDYAIVANGYFFATEGATGSADRLALVLKVGDQDFDGDYRNVKLLLSDGTTTTTKAYWKNGTDKEDPVVGTLYTYTSSDNGYVLKTITDGKTIGMDQPVLTAKNYNSATNKVDTTRVAVDAKVFVLYDGVGTSPDYSSYSGKLVTGATADKWEDANYTTTVAYTDGNVKIMVVKMGNKDDIPNATDDSQYGVIVSAPYKDVDAKDNNVWVVDLLTKDGVVPGISIEEGEIASGLTLVKNMLITYKMDGSDYVDVAKAPKNATAITGAVVDVDGKYVTVGYNPTSITYATIELKVDADDSTILYVDTDSGIAATGEIKEAGKYDEDALYANIMVIYKSDKAESDGTNLIWGAAIDANNMLQDDDDEDVVIEKFTSPPAP